METGAPESGWGSYLIVFLKMMVSDSPLRAWLLVQENNSFYAKYTAFCWCCWFSFCSLLSLQKKGCVKIRWLVHTTIRQKRPCQILPAMPTQCQSLLQSINTQLPGKSGTPYSSSHYFSMCQAACSKPTFSSSASGWPHPQQMALSWANSQPSTSPALPVVTAEAVKAKRKKKLTRKFPEVPQIVKAGVCRRAEESSDRPVQVCQGAWRLTRA